MSKSHDGDMVIVLTEDGRRSELATFHGWTKRPGPDGEEAWYAPSWSTATGRARRRRPVPRRRARPLPPKVYCDRNPITRETFHSPGCIDENLMDAGQKVWA